MRLSFCFLLTCWCASVSKLRRVSSQDCMKNTQDRNKKSSSPPPSCSLSNPSQLHVRSKYLRFSRATHQPMCDACSVTQHFPVTPGHLGGGVAFSVQRFFTGFHGRVHGKNGCVTGRLVGFRTSLLLRTIRLSRRPTM
jgi:hypothetical protein